MSKQLVFHPEAEAEATEAVRWYGERSEQAAADFELELKSACEAIRHYRQQFPVHVSQTGRYHSLRKFPYAVIYAELEDSILVLAVAHARRRPGYWRNRASGH